MLPVISRCDAWSSRVSVDNSLADARVTYASPHGQGRMPAQHVSSHVQVQPEAALAAAHQLALEYGIWQRPLGLAGVWGGLVRAWLDELLPDDAHVQCSGRVKLVVTEVQTP